MCVVSAESPVDEGNWREIVARRLGSAVKVVLNCIESLQREIQRRERHSFKSVSTSTLSGAMATVSAEEAEPDIDFDAQRSTR